MSRIPLILALAFAAALAGADAPAPLASGLDPANFDASIRPQDNFFLYANGNWIRKNTIPPEYSRWGAFNMLRDQNSNRLHDLLKDLATSALQNNSDAHKLSDFFATAMDEARLQQQGITPLAEHFNQIDAIRSLEDLSAQLARFRAQGNPFLFGFSVGVDARQSDRYAPYLRQGGLGLPEREYYLGDTPDSQRIRAEYRTHILAMFKLLGDPEERATRNADTILRLETRLAEASRSPVQLRDREANYNKKTLAELATLAPSIQWLEYFKILELPTINDVIVGQPEFFERLNTLLVSTPVDDWKTYLRWHLIRSTAPYLSSPFENENFRFYSQVMRGTTQMQPRWKRAISTLDSRMGEALGKRYVEKHFTPDAKKRMDDLVKNLLAAYRERIESRTWMGEETKKQALAKLATFTPKIGYPEKWRDYSLLEIKNDSYAQNVLRANAFESRYRLDRLGKPVDKTEWSMTPPTVNAYYNSTFNEIVFPAGILQPPFFNPAADDAVNYGAIGAIIGHEISHGFDDQGSRSDAHGNLKNWWTPEDRARFNALTDKLVAQYDACVAVDDLTVNGKLTLGENIADLGGVAIAYAAYLKSLDGKPAPIIDGFTGPQRFFLGYAQVWRDHVRDADQRLLLRTDTHSPARFRVMVPLTNIAPYYEAFNVQPGDKMYRPPADRVEVW